MIADQLVATLTLHAMNPLIVVVGIILATFLLEDAATVAVGLLASQMIVDPALAIAALVVGTVVGDLTLHLLGRYAGGTRWAGRIKATDRVRKMEAWLQRRSLVAIAAARFMPGFRLPTFVASGFLRVPVGKVAIVITGVTLVWTPGLFLLSQSAGMAGLGTFGLAGWALGTVLIALVLAAPKLTPKLVALRHGARA
jgi:membrane protein DedA with SNARE-associated domain